TWRVGCGIAPRSLDDEGNGLHHCDSAQPSARTKGVRLRRHAGAMIAAPSTMSFARRTCSLRTTSHSANLYSMPIRYCIFFVGECVTLAAPQVVAKYFPV